MIVQVYEDGLIRLFDRDDKVICDLAEKRVIKRGVDHELARLKIRRREQWQDEDWGSWAKVRFKR
jgi:hypothetical protein